MFFIWRKNGFFAGILLLKRGMLMEEGLAIQNLRTQIDERLNQFKPVIKSYGSSDFKIFGCQLVGMVDGRSFKAYGLAETEDIAFLKAKNKLIAQTYHLSYPLSKKSLFSCAAFNQASMAYDRALRSFLAQAVLSQSLDGAGIPLQIPVRESSFIWENDNRYAFSNYCLAVTDGPINMTVVVALAIPSGRLGLPLLVGLGYANSVEDSSQRAWHDLIEKCLSDKLFGEHQNEFDLISRVEFMAPEELKNWLMAPKADAQKPILINLERINKEILFADSDITVVRVSEPL